MKKIRGLLFIILSGMNLLICAEDLSQSRHEVKIGYYQYDGYHMLDAHGRKSGYGYEYLQHMLRYVPWQYTYIGYEKNWREMLTMLENGEIDILTNIRKTPEREKKFLFSEKPIGISSTMITVKAGNTRYLPNDFRKWNGIRIGIMKNDEKDNDLESYAKEHGFTYIPVYFNSLREMKQALQTEKDIDALAAPNLRYLQNEWIYAILEPKPFYLAVRKNNPALMKEAESAIRQLNLFWPELPSLLTEKYYKVLTNQEVPFTSEEREFIRKSNEEHRVFYALLNPDRAPFSYLDEYGELKGILKDIADEFILRTGLDIRLLKTSTRTEYRKALDRPDVVIVLDAWNNFQNAERRNLILSKPYLKTMVSLLRLKKNTAPPKTIAAMEDSEIIQSMFRKLQKKQSFTYYSSIADVVNAVRLGKQDAAYLYAKTAELAIHCDPENVLTADLLNQESTSYAIGVKESAPVLLAAIVNKAISSLNENFIENASMRHTTSLTQKFSINAVVYQHPYLTLGIPLLVLMLAAAILLLLLHSRKKALAAVKRTGEKLKDTNNFLNTIINTLPFCFFVKDADHEFRYIMGNRNFADFQKRPLSEIIGKNDAELHFSLLNSMELDSINKEIMHGTEGKEFCTKIRDGNGEIHYMDLFQCPLIRGDGKRLLIGGSVDVTQVHNLLDSERINNEVLSFITMEMDFEKILSHIADTLRSHLNCNVVILAKCNDRGLLRLYREWHDESVPPLNKDNLAAHYQVWNQNLDLMRGNKLIDIPDLQHHPLTEALTASQKTSLRSMLITPIMLQEKLWGAIFVAFSQDTHHFTKIDKNIMRAMANLISMAQLRKSQREQLDLFNRENQMILNNLDIPIWLHDPDGKIVRMNSAVIKMTEMTEREIKENFCIGKLHCANSQEQCPVRLTMQDKKPHQITFCHKDKEYIIKTMPILDQEGSLLHIVKNAIDVSALNAFIKNEKFLNFCLETLFRENNIEKAIKHVLEMVCRHMKASRSYLIQFDPDLTTASGYAEAAVSEPRKVIMRCKNYPFSKKYPWYKILEGRKLLKLPDLQSDEAKKTLNVWHRILIRNHMKSAYMSGIFLDGMLWGVFGVIYEEEPVRLSSLNQNLLKSMAHLFELMLERMRVREQLEEAVRKAQAADRAKTYFLASMSHEIRTPLNAVIGFSELLRDNAISPDLEKDYLAGISTAGNALLALINDVLDLSKLEAGQMDFYPEETRFGTLLREVGGIFIQKCNERGLQLIYEVPALPNLFLDKLRLRQILFNLIGNSLKFTDHGFIRLRAEFSPETLEEGTLIFSVADSGIGIAETDQKTLFDPFVQGAAMRGTHAANNGTGLGLAIVRRMLQKMNGDIAVESEVGKGSAFTVTIHQVRFTSNTDLPSPDSATESGAESTRLPEGHQIPILLVDDVPMNLKVLEAMLKKFNVRVFMAQSGAEAIKILESNRMEVVLTDLWMPRMNGEELARKIRSNPIWRDIRIAALTADTENSQNFDIRIFDVVMTKPVTLEKLKENCGLSADPA